MLHISVSSLSDFMTCRRLYFWKRIKKYDRFVFSIPFLVGRVVHEGIGHLFSKKPNVEALIKGFYTQEKALIKNQLILTQDQKEELDEQEFIVQAMVKAYARKYEKLIREAKHLESEVEGSIQLDDNVTFVIKLDNLFRIKSKKVLHELKTSKYITPDYIKHIQTDRQTGIYFHLYNIIFEESKIDEIKYDIIRKPSIRQKKNETYKVFLDRLVEWYRKPEDMSVFHMEGFEKPVVSAEESVNTVMKVSDEMLRSKSKDDYYQNTEHCHSYYGNRCPYYELCHEGGETPGNLKLYQIRKPYHVDKKNTGVRK